MGFSRPPVEQASTVPRREAEPIWSCSGWGLPGYPDHSVYGGLLPHLFTLTRRGRRLAVRSQEFGVRNHKLLTHHSPLKTPRQAGQAVCFCGTFLVPVRSAPASSQKQSVLRTTLPCGARTFLPSQSPAFAGSRRSGHLFPFDSPPFLKISIKISDPSD